VVNSLLKRLEALDPARLAGVAAALVVALILGAWVVAAATAPWSRGQLAAAIAAAALGLAALLYPFRLGADPASR
jgi:hypothetical protein